MGNPAKNLKQSLSDLLGAGRSDQKRQQQRRDHKFSSQSSKKRQKIRSKPADSSNTNSNSSNSSSSGKKSWRTSSLRADDLDLGSKPLPSPSPAAVIPASASVSDQCKSQSFRNLSANWASAHARSAALAPVQLGGIVMRRSTSANSFASRTHDDDPSYLAFEKLFNQFQGKPPDTRKVLVTITVLGTIGRLRLFIADTATVPELIAMALGEYAHEGRLPPLGRNAKAFHLYLTPFHPQPLPPQETIKRLGTRSFVLCPTNQAPSPRCKSSAEMPKGSRSWWRIITGISSNVALVL
ncbi:hypothetical protein O6H91_12G080600 [Diphasiastrum complanatum]|uniref:Uncharacterized protein n=1 Tax=Diphasiastrum complanatum TaxID=34168 RepID=A0ACC2C410_DIPCM|nr:hypothetical protein O6H91_Y348700 [Diphasiastrum complanatum]KAJ7536741.1 hypothetical protein O6H91_12G080600 [Diphasiastrum complanatum]